MNIISMELAKIFYKEKHEIRERGLREFINSEYRLQDRLHAIARIRSAQKNHRKFKWISGRSSMHPIIPDSAAESHYDVCMKQCVNVSSCKC
ncbi:MAG: hypothetical protein M1476_06835 [Candidatus Thermoplasmatota archaeon]|nr:hypothetical protein [Candidatus Thermoplasmatota archaeon]